MCGIAGILVKSGSFDLSLMMESMLSEIRHRGPDGEGTYVDKNLILGHRRLSIIDLSHQADQPMHYNDNLVIIYNGEIYNYLELRTELKEKGFIFKTQSDTEVILAAYDCWGDSCVERFNGMWAFAIYDIKNKRVFCSRDRFGIKPFYYYQNDNLLCFGSEIKQILKIKSNATANRQVLLNYLFSGLEEYNDESFYAEIHRLEPGTNLTFDLRKNAMTLRKYYSLKPAILDNENELFLIDQFKGLLKDSIRLRLRSDVRVGTCLSGGLDSSAIATLATGLYQEFQDEFKLTGYHGKSIEKDTDESQFALQVALHAGFKLKMTEQHLSDFHQVLPKVIKTHEEPFGSPSVVMQYFVMQLAHESGAKVMLDGQGGDELLLGYERYFVSWLYQQKGLSKILNFNKAVQNSKLRPLTLLQYYFYFTQFNIRWNRLKKRFSFFRPEVIRAFDKTLVREHITDFRHFETLQVKEITKYQLPHLLKYEDKNSMAHSIEARVPFLDHRLVELSLALPMELKIRSGWSKYILRKAIEPDLPETITWRKNKFGFQAPVNTWLADHSAIEKQISKSVILSKLIKKRPLPFNDLSVIWRLYNISMWEETFNVSLDFDAL